MCSVIMMTLCPSPPLHKTNPSLGTDREGTDRWNGRLVVIEIGTEKGKIGNLKKNRYQPSLRGTLTVSLTRCPSLQIT
jgi:hypothetical protein